MKTNTRAIAAGAAALAVALAAGHAHALAQRTFVASGGNDSNACTLTAPCRSFAAAVALASAGGEVVVLDSAAYGPVALAKSVSIVAPPGVYAGISVTAGNGVTVNGAGIEVALRGLTITGLGGATGVLFAAGSELVVERCTIGGMSDNGIDVRAPGSTTFVADSSVRGSGNSGLYADAFGGSVRVVVSRSRFESNQWGLFARQGARASIVDSQFTRNSAIGVYALVDNGAQGFETRIAVESSLLSANGTGMKAELGAAASSAARAFARAVRSTFTGHAGPAAEALTPPALAAHAAVFLTANVMSDNDVPVSVTYGDAYLNGNDLTGNAGDWSVGAPGKLYSHSNNSFGGNTYPGALTPIPFD